MKKFFNVILNLFALGVMLLTSFLIYESDMNMVAGFLLYAIIAVGVGTFLHVFTHGGSPRRIVVGVLLFIPLFFMGCSSTDFEPLSHPVFDTPKCGTSPGRRPLVPMNYVLRIEAGEADHCDLILTDTLRETVEKCEGAYDTRGCWVTVSVVAEDLSYVTAYEYGYAPKQCENTIVHELAHCLGWRHP